MLGGVGIYFDRRQKADRQKDFEDIPEQLTRELIEEKLQEARERLKKYEGYQRIMEENGQSQMSLTDAEAKLMKSKNGFVVVYNLRPQSIQKHIL